MAAVADAEAPLRRAQSHADRIRRPSPAPGAAAERAPVLRSPSQPTLSTARLRPALPARVVEGMRVANAASRSGALVRMPSVGSSSTRDFVCPICFGEFGVRAAAFSVAACREHACCVECAAGYVEQYLLRGGAPSAMRCPADDSCDSRFVQEDVDALQARLTAWARASRGPLRQASMTSVLGPGGAVAQADGGPMPVGHGEAAAATAAAASESAPADGAAMAKRAAGGPALGQASSADPLREPLAAASSYDGVARSTSGRPAGRSDAAQTERRPPESLADRFRRFAARESGRATECPSCGAMVACRPDQDPSSGADGSAAMECKCGLRFCFHHATAHPPEESCDAYIRRTAESELDRELNAFSVKCPSCSARVAKASGCNTMHCRCSAEFCFLCGQLLKGEGDESAGWHFSLGNVESSCRGRQFAGGHANSRAGMKPSRCSLVVSRTIQLILCVPMALVSPAIVAASFALLFPSMLSAIAIMAVSAIASALVTIVTCGNGDVVCGRICACCGFTSMDDFAENALYCFVFSPILFASAWLSYAFAPFGCASSFSVTL